VQTWQERHDTAREHLVPFLQSTTALDGATVVEFGAGSGAISCALAPHVERLIGLDILEGDIGEARHQAAERGFDGLRFESGSFEELLEHARAAEGADVFLMYAVLEHMTISERIATLTVAKEVLAEDGLLAVFETPNRLLWWDHHTSIMPFFGMLPDELAIRYADRSPRGDLPVALVDGDEPAELTLARWGRGASQHEFELVFGDLGGKLVAGGYAPLLLPLRHVHREELALDRFMRGVAKPPSPLFSRFWLDVVLSPSGTVASRELVEPWPFATSVADGTELTAWETLRFVRDGAAITIPATGGTGVVLGVEVGGDGATLDVWSEQRLVGSVELAPADLHTAYVEVPIEQPANQVTVRAHRPIDISFAGIRRVTVT
jgi:hypothetical protein